MHNEFTAIIEKDGDWFIAYCPEIPGANGQGRTREEAKASLAEAISLILEDRRQDALRGVPDDATKETPSIKSQCPIKQQTPMTKRAGGTGQPSPRQRPPRLHPWCLEFGI